MADALSTLNLQNQYKEICSFPGDGSKTIDEFLEAVQHTCDVVKGDDSARYQTIYSNLDLEAKQWYQENKSGLTTLTELRKGLRERYKNTRSPVDILQRIEQRKQQPNESVQNFYDDLTRLCKSFPNGLPESYVLAKLTQGIKLELREQVLRQFNAADTQTSAEFLKISLSEESLKKLLPLAETNQQQYFSYDNSLIATSFTIPPRSNSYKNNASTQRQHQPQDTQQQRYLNNSSDFRSEQEILGSQRIYSNSNRFNRQQSRQTQPEKMDSRQAAAPLRPCLICGRPNHRTINCWHKKHNGCFKSGAPDGGVPMKKQQPSSSACPVIIKVRINNTPQTAIVDTGAATTIVHQNVLKHLRHRKIQKSANTFMTATNTAIHTTGTVDLIVDIGSFRTYVTAEVSTNLVTNVLLGNDWIQKNKINIDGADRRVYVKGTSISLKFEDPEHIQYPVLLIDQAIIRPGEEKLIDVGVQVEKSDNMIFEPSQRLFTYYRTINRRSFWLVAMEIQQKDRDSSPF
ncbi:unnamed protein product [Didymodactylos carnosus]|uniref:Peptidase A2 domain-containing protein n=1 Tax=Didymodactylos carnosus TaxID=1234261 RepID=A0A8S2DA54_9BILA|nr:unnamed protein product [Didymodactylos carnosus]CAF3667260.1 unnamed protein product [Didymodactylos carnosus]